MPSKLSLHLNGYPDRVFDIVQRMRPGIIKIFNQSSELNIAEIRRRSNPLIIYRHFSNLDYHNSSADMFFAEMQEAFRKLRGKGIIWEGMNEPIVGSVEDAKALNAWWVRFAKIMHENGEMIAAFSWSTGNPTAAVLPKIVPYLVDAAAAADLHAFHEYYSRWAKKGDWCWYRTFEKALPPQARKPVIITEAGMDDNGDPSTGGFRGKISNEEYLQILKDYDAAIMKDPYVLGATIFEWGDNGWLSFDLTPMVDLFANYVASSGGGLPVPRPWPVPVYEQKSFTVTPSSIKAGESATLKWDVEGVQGVYLDDEGVVGHGSKTVTPTQTTMYTLRIVYRNGSSENLKAQVTVTSSPVTLLQDGLVGLAINPGLRDIVMPSADQLRGLSMPWVRFLVTKQFQDFQTGQNSELDVLINRCREIGVRILVLVNPETLGENAPPSGSPKWGNGDSGYIGRVADVARKIAVFYAGRIHAIEIWNEPDGQEIAAETYADMLAAAYAKIKAVSKLPVISAGICCGQNHAYLERVVKRAPNACDGVGWHPYGLSIAGYPARTWGFGDFGDSIVRARAVAGKPLWLTEFGAELSYDWSTTGKPPAEAIADYMRRAYTRLRELGPDTVVHAFWFTWKCVEAGWGLVDNEAHPRPAWYAFKEQATVPPAAGPVITETSLTPSKLEMGKVLNVSITVRNASGQTLATQGPEPGFIYEEGDSYAARGHKEVKGAFRVAIDFDGRTGPAYPYRWGFGAPLAPGETRNITGGIRLRSVQSKNYWAGLVQELVAWVQDKRGVQGIAVKSSPQITNVTFAPQSLSTGQLLQVSVTVVNPNDTALPTQGPEPGYIYDQGDTFASRGHPDTAGNWRVGIDFENRSGVDHPYRWGFGRPLAPGETRTITGSIRMKNPHTAKYWAGLVTEGVGWVQDQQGVQSIRVAVAPGGEPPQISGVDFAPSTLAPGQLLKVSFTVKNNLNVPLATQAPNPDVVYEEGESFYSRGFPDVKGAFRVAVDFDGRNGIDHPYRWGLGTPLAPGESRTIVGSIRLKTARSGAYWAGLAQEQVAWLQDRVGVKKIQVQQPTPGVPQIVDVNFTPAILPAGDKLQVSITVRNNSNAPLSTQGPEPGTEYDEGDSFYSHGFASIPGACRVGVDFADRTGIDHPYRWGFGTPLAPGETRVISGTIHLKRAQSQSYWAGLAREHMAWLQDREGTQTIRVTPGTTQSRVVHVHDSNATAWNGQASYWAHVNQDRVNAMLESGLKALTGSSTPLDAWRAVLPGYQPGQVVAIKVNLSNGGAGGKLDSSIQPLNAVLRGLKSLGVKESDIWVYQAVNNIPDRFIQMCQYRGVAFYDSGAIGSHRRTLFESSDPSATAAFSPPAGVAALPRIKIADILVKATFLVNMPLLKGHKSGAGVSLGFKNHLGSINNPEALHPYVFLEGKNFTTSYNPLVDLYRNPNIRNKTVLTVGDGLFATDDAASPAYTMKTFGNKTPNSLFLATDPVALDCVMSDILSAEWSLPVEGGSYLRLAGEAGLGTFERGDPRGKGYNKITYQKVEMP